MIKVLSVYPNIRINALLRSVNVWLVEKSMPSLFRGALHIEFTRSDSGGQC